MATRRLLGRRVVTPPAAPAAGAAAPAAVVVGFYATYVAWVFTKKMLWALLTIVVAIALMWALALYNWDPKALWLGITTSEIPGVRAVPGWVVVLVAFMVLVGIYLSDKKELRSLVVITCVILFFFGTMGFDQKGEINVGDRIWVFRIVGVMLFLLVYTYTEGWKQLAYVALLGFTFLMFECTPYLSWGQFSAWFPWSGQWGGQHVASAPPVTRTPLGMTLTATLGPTPVELNPGGKYKIHWHEIDQNQCINVYGPSGQYLGNDCDGDVDLHDTAMFASAGDEPVSITYVLSMGP
jgi:hypothetical protein